MSVWITFDTSKISGKDIEGNIKMSDKNIESGWEKQIKKAYDLALDYMKEDIIVTLKITNSPPPKRRYPLNFTRASDIES